MFKIVVDATPIYQKPNGVGFYVANLISELNALQELENFQFVLVLLVKSFIKS